MPLGSGLAAQLMVKAESTYGTAVTVDRALPFISESLSAEFARMESEAIIAGRRTRTSEQWETGATTIQGSIELEALRQGTGPLWLAAFGANATTGASNPFTHTLTPGDLAGDSLTIQVGRPLSDGSAVAPFTFNGCKIAAWEVKAESGEIGTMSFDVIARDVTRATALATATYAAGAARAYTFVHGSLSIGGAAQKVKGFTLKGDNGLADDRRFVGSALIDEPTEADVRVYDGQFTIEWASTAAWDAYRAGTEAALVLGFTASVSESMIFTCNVRYDGYDPEVDGPGIMEVDVPFTCVASGADSTAISLALKNSQATPV